MFARREEKEEYAALVIGRKYREERIKARR